MEKRCFNTQEAMEYLGVKRRFFETTLAPTLEGKGIRAGRDALHRTGSRTGQSVVEDRDSPVESGHC